MFLYLVRLSLGLYIAYSSLNYFGLQFAFSDCFPFVEGSDNVTQSNYKYLYLNLQSLDDITESVEMAQKVRVLCWILTCPENHQKKSIHVKKTWGRRCNKLLFMSTGYDETLPTVKLSVKEGRNHLWGKTKAAFRYIYENHRTEADWFFKADDDTYTIVENLRYMLSGYNSQELLYFGFRFKPYTEQGYMSGGAGYVISRSSLDLLYSHGLNGNKICIQQDEGHDEDAKIGRIHCGKTSTLVKSSRFGSRPRNVYLYTKWDKAGKKKSVGICLDKLGVKAMDTRDYRSRGRFFPFSPVDHFFPSEDKSFWYWNYIYYNTTDGLHCCSDYAITFHYTEPRKMYVYEYFVYRLRPYGINFYMGEPPGNMIANDSSISTATIKNLIKIKQRRNYISNIVKTWQFSVQPP